MRLDMSKLFFYFLKLPLTLSDTFYKVLKG